MVDLNKLSDAAREAAMRGGTASWGSWGSSEHHVRYMEPVGSRERRRCGCGCKTRATHRGFANGVALVSGCELKVRRWVWTGNLT